MIRGRAALGARLAQATEEAKRGSGPQARENIDGRRPKKTRPSLDDPARWDMVLVGDDGLMLFNRSSTDWIISPHSRFDAQADVPSTIRRVPNEDVEWVEACKGGPKPLSSFDYSGPFTEMVNLGNLAVRLGKKIEWDGSSLKVTNEPEADALIRPERRTGWSLPQVPSLRVSESRSSNA